MRKIIIISIFIFVILLSSSIGYKIVSANTKINETEDIITYQKNQEKYLIHYNFTIDNPNIILNPYDISPLSAIIIFETEEEEAITVTIKGKDTNSTYTNTFNKTKEHYIPIFGLYPNYNNEIIITCGNIEKKYYIKTDKLPEDLIPITKENKTNKLYFITSNKYPYAIDNNNEIRWYLTKEYNGKISQLENGHLLLGNDLITNNNYKTGLLEIDLLGKVYNDYNIGEYHGSYTETNNSILILSNKIIEIDKTSGEIKRNIKINKDYNTIDYNRVNNKIVLTKDNIGLEIDYTTLEKNEINLSNTVEEKISLLPLYSINDYKLKDGIKTNYNEETKTSKQKVLLLNYKNIDEEYLKKDITINKNTDKLIIKINLDKSEKAYIILDKFLGKKVYNLKNGYNYINKENLSGDYSIYIKINDSIYKTNKYVTF